jgi:hypothetical protein
MLPAGTQPAAPLIMESRRRPRVRQSIALADLAKRSRERFWRRDPGKTDRMLLGYARVSDQVALEFRQRAKHVKNR